MQIDEFGKYYSYLKTRSLFGKFYRKFYLYPKLTKLLHGVALDVGCGIGDMLRYRNGTIGVDINPHSISFCVSTGLKAFLIESDLIPFNDSSFDSVLLDNVLEHVADPTNLMFEVSRVLKRNGTLVVGVPGLKGQAADLDHKKYYNEAALEALADKSGFKVKKYMYAPLFRSAFLSRTLTQYCIYTQWQKID